MKLHVELMTDHHWCHCEKSIGCQCCDGYMSASVDSQSAQIYGACEPAPCDIPNSNRLPGLNCQCLHGFVGALTWKGSEVSGWCTPPPR